MLLIAITGPPGAGKTQRLTALAEWAHAGARRVSGFTAEADAREHPHAPAASYTLRFWPDGERRPFARRDPSAKHLPYRFDADTQAATRRWAEGLGAIDLVVLDEFGKLESRGEGHAALWPLVAAARPGVVAIGVRENCVAEVEARLGRRFDLVIEAGDAQALPQLQRAMRAQEDWSRVGLYGSGAGALEMTLGSALHGAQVPLRGLAMASAQAALLAISGQGLGDRRRVVWVPFIAAGLKALSPTGSRLRPMLAITVQGIFFAGATRLLGWNALGVTMGAALVGGWAAAQGLVLQYLLIGRELLRAYAEVVRFLERTWGLHPPAIATALACWVALWAVVAGAAGALAYRRAGRALDAEPGQLPLPGWLARFVEAPALRVDQPRTWRHAALGGIQDLSRPVFWLPIALVVGVLVATGSPAESAFWVVVRAASVGFVLFSLARAFDPRGLVAWLQGRGHWGPALAFARALEAFERPATGGRA